MNQYTRYLTIAILLVQAPSYLPVSYTHLGLNTYRVLNAGVVVLTENSLKAIDNILI